MRMTALEWIFFILVVIGGINWGLIGFFDYNLVAELIESENIQRIIYSLVGLSTIALLITVSMRADVRDTDV